MLNHGFLGTSDGILMINGVSSLYIAEKYGTPAYIMDEETIRSRCALYAGAMKKHFGDGSYPLYASKAFSCKKIYKIVDSEGLGADIVSLGEMYTALAAGFPMNRVYFHGNNKTDADIEAAIAAGVGVFVVDNTDELLALDRICAQKGVRQKILLRITPGIDAHTHKAITTGNVDSKFGTAILTGQALEITARALSLGNVELSGFHCHIGSQIFDSEPFENAAEIMLDFVAEVRNETGYVASELNLGGGFAVQYIPEQPQVDYTAQIERLAARIKALCAKHRLPLPSIRLEPGRSIVADSGLTLYTVGSVKEITGFRSYVSVDGGMPDNPRYALYNSRYEAVVANRADKPADYCCTIAGRCCESGDLIAEDIKIQKPKRGDILAVLVTGAYNYSMASNYNRLTRPPVIMVNGRSTETIVERESFFDLLGNDK